MPRVVSIFAVLGGPLAWSVHLLLSYLLVTLACSTEWTSIGPALAITTAFSVLLSALAGVVAYRRWQGVSTDTHQDQATFLMLVGMMLAGLFLLAIVLGGLVPLSVPYCA
jgi:glucose uptake protein GlcU